MSVEERIVYIHVSTLTGERPDGGTHYSLRSRPGRCSKRWSPGTWRFACIGSRGWSRVSKRMTTISGVSRGALIYPQPGYHLIHSHSDTELVFEEHTTSQVSFLPNRRIVFCVICLEEVVKLQSLKCQGPRLLWELH